MEATIFVRQLNATDYQKLGNRDFQVLPRQDEYISAEANEKRHIYQVIGVHHAVEDGVIEIYAVENEPPWHVKKSRAIGFGR